MCHQLRFGFLLLILVLAPDVDGQGDTRPNRPLGPAAAVFESKEFWFADAQAALHSKIAAQPIETRAKNVVFFLGDGMSVATITAARILKGQRDAGQYSNGGEEAKLHFESFPHVGVAKTFCTDLQVPDSACTATAFLCGTKANDATIGLTPAVNQHDSCNLQHVAANQVSSVLAWAQAAGKATGVVTTTRITHATPAGTYAHIGHRDWESDAGMRWMGQDPDACDDIAEQLILREPGRSIDVVFGGGRRELLPNTTADIENPAAFGRRQDGKNLIQDWIDGNGGAYITFREELLALEADLDSGGTEPAPEKVLGLFAYDHLGYFDQLTAAGDPSLEEMVRVAIKLLQQRVRVNADGFFLLVEGGRIDHAHHAGQAKRALLETLELDRAVRAADELTDDSDTLLVVTADHAHTMTIGGYPFRGNDILGLVPQLGTDGLPFTTLSYANGPGYRPPYNDTSRVDIGQDPFHDDSYRQIATVPFGEESHGGDDVLILSKGPFAHYLTGVQQQSYIPHVIGYAACIGDGVQAKFCDGNREPDAGNGTGGSSPVCCAVCLAITSLLLILVHYATNLI